MNINDSVEGTPFLTQLYIHFALYIHEYKTSSEPNCYHNQLSPEWPFQCTLLDLFGGAFYEDIQGPNNTGDGDDVEGDGTRYLASLHPRHVQLLPLVERFDLGVHDEVELAKFATPGV